MDAVRQVSIIGLGLIGGSIGLAIKGRHSNILIKGFDSDSRSSEKALHIGAVDEASANLKEAVLDSDVVFIAVPVNSVVSLTKELAGYVKSDCILTDVGSTKTSIFEAIKESSHLIKNFIGGHPMTGSEVTGIEGATGDLFKDSYYVLTPTQDTDAQQYNKLYAFLKSLGPKVIALDPEKHDKIMSLISHLPHAISAALVNTVGTGLEEDDNLTLIAAGGFRDMTRIAGSNPDVWVDIFLSNSAAVNKAIDKFVDEIECFKSKLKNSDKRALRDWIQRAGITKIKTQGPEVVGQQQTLRVFIPDKPGAISDVTVAIGSKAINIEDMQMIHTENNRAILECRVSGKDKAIEAAREIRKKGYQVKLVEGLLE